VDLSHGNGTIEPGDDFYRHVNGRWLDSYELKPDEMRYGAFIKLQYRAEEQVKTILDELSRRTLEPGSIEQKIADYVKSFMDAPGLEKKGISPLEGDLEAIASIKSPDGLIEAFGRAELMETNAPIMTGVAIDRRNPDRYQLNVAHAGLGLPDRSYYLEESFEQVVDAYEAHVATMLGFTGLGEADAKQAAAAVVKLETAIARHHWPRAELRNRDKTHNVRTLSALEAEVRGYPWRKHLRAAGIALEKLLEVNVFTPSALAPLAKLVSQTPLQTWKHYLSYHLVAHHAPLLGDTIDDAAFAFKGKVLGGQQEQRERWKRAIMLVGDHDALGEAIGKLYVARHFPPEAEAKMSDLVRNLRAALHERIEALPWMGPETKKQALEKLAKFNPKIGHPEKWRDFASISIVANDLMQNYRAV
jgi:predicted metalloendopeptidase